MDKYLQRLETELAKDCKKFIVVAGCPTHRTHPINCIITHFTSHKIHMDICIVQMQINLQIDKTVGQIIVEGKKVRDEPQVTR